MKDFIFVTGSQNKVIEAERLLRVKLQSQAIDLPEIQSVDLEEIITKKAMFAYEVLGGQSVIVEDTGLFIEAWNGLPGALVKWFIERVGVAGICKMMHEFPDKKAWAKTVVATHDGEIKLFAGQVNGRIAETPVGNAGFGWDKIFVPTGADKTFAEMSASEKDAYSMRRKAFESMRTYYSHLFD